MARDSYNTSTSNIQLLKMLILITLLYSFTALQDISSTNRDGNTALLFFFTINIYTLFNCAICKFDILISKTSKIDELFPNEIIILPIESPSYKNLYGIMISSSNIYDNLKNVAITSFVTNNNECLNTVGDPDILKDAINKLYGERNTKVEKLTNV